MQMLDVAVWGGFTTFVLGLLALDLGVFHRETRALRSSEALAWAGFYFSLALAFNVLVYFLYENNWLGVGLSVGHPMDGETAALQFLTGYLLEQSLSLDNVFVIALIFGYFRIPLQYQHRVLFWGILGALVMRGVMIGAGAAVVAEFQDELQRSERLRVLGQFSGGLAHQLRNAAAGADCQRNEFQPGETTNDVGIALGHATARHHCIEVSSRGAIQRLRCGQHG